MKTMHDNARQCMSEFFAYLDDYVHATRSKMDYFTSDLDQREVSNICQEAINILRKPISNKSFSNSLYFSVSCFSIEKYI